MVGDLKSKSVKGVIWSFVESASTKVIQFVISVIMARLLMPEDYGKPPSMNTCSLQYHRYS